MGWNDIPIPFVTRGSDLKALRFHLRVESTPAFLEPSHPSDLRPKGAWSARSQPDRETSGYGRSGPVASISSRRVRWT